MICSECGYSKSGLSKDKIKMCLDCGAIWPANMKAKQIRALCPVKIGQEYKSGKVIYILGDSDGYDVWTKHEQIDTTAGLINMPIYREVQHRINR